MLHRRSIISSLKPLQHRSCFCHLTTTTSQILSSTSFFHHHSSSHTNSNHHKRRTSDHQQNHHHSNSNNNRNQQSSSSSASSSSFHQTSAPFFSNRMSTPFVVKDREPFPGTELRDGKLKLAVLIDGEKVNPENYQKFAEKEISQSGTICLRRYFRYEKVPEWSSLFHRGVSSTSEAEVSGEQSGMDKNNKTSTSGKTNTNTTSSLPRKTPNTASIDTLLGPPQFFRVDSFIPINMQLSADAAHIVEFKNENLVTGVVFVVAKDEVPAYETLIENNFLGQQVKMFVVDGDAEGKVRVKK